MILWEIWTYWTAYLRSLSFCHLSRRSALGSHIKLLRWIKVPSYPSRSRYILLKQTPLSIWKLASLSPPHTALPHPYKSLYQKVSIPENNWEQIALFPSGPTADKQNIWEFVPSITPQVSRECRLNQFSKQERMKPGREKRWRTQNSPFRVTSGAHEFTNTEIPNQRLGLPSIPPTLDTGAGGEGVRIF